MALAVEHAQRRDALVALDAVEEVRRVGLDLAQRVVFLNAVSAEHIRSTKSGDLAMPTGYGEKCGTGLSKPGDAQSCAGARSSAGSAEAWATRSQGQKRRSGRAQRPPEGCRRLAWLQGAQRSNRREAGTSRSAVQAKLRACGGLTRTCPRRCGPNSFASAAGAAVEWRLSTRSAGRLRAPSVYAEAVDEALGSLTTAGLEACVVVCVSRTLRAGCSESEDDAVLVCAFEARIWPFSTDKDALRRPVRASGGAALRYGSKERGQYAHGSAGPPL